MNLTQIWSRCTTIPKLKFLCQRFKSYSPNTHTYTHTHTPTKTLPLKLKCQHNFRIGSDEDDEGVDDETMSNEDPSETAVSRDARNESAEHPAAAPVDFTNETKSEADKTGSVVENEQEKSQQPVVNHVNGQVRIVDIICFLSKNWF